MKSMADYYYINKLLTHKKFSRFLITQLLALKRN